MPLGVFLGVRGGVFLPPSEMLTAHGEGYFLPRSWFCFGLAASGGRVAPFLHF